MTLQISDTHVHSHTHYIHEVCQQLWGIVAHVLPNACISVTQQPRDDWLVCSLTIMTLDCKQKTFRKCFYYYQYSCTYLKCIWTYWHARHLTKLKVNEEFKQGLPYFLIGVARRHGKHVGLFSKYFSPVPLADLHAVLKMVLVVRVKGLDAATKKLHIQTFISWHISAIYWHLNILLVKSRPQSHYKDVDHLCHRLWCQMEPMQKQLSVCLFYNNKLIIVFIYPFDNVNILGERIKKNTRKLLK